VVNWKVCKDHRKADDARRYARRRAKLTEKLARRQSDICTWCGYHLPSDLARVEIDHIIPKAAGFIIEDEWNLQALHPACNYAKGALITAGAVALAAEHGINVAAA
jgi:5-methylcytosine-specific restriction endonuclease McrA